MATVNGKDISRSDLDKAYINYKATQGEAPREPSVEQANTVRLNLLQKLIDDEILQQRAEKLNLAASEEDVNAKLTELKAPYTQEEFDKQLKQRNMTLDDLKQQIRRNLTSEKLINKEINSKIAITDADGTVHGEFRATGLRPRCLDEMQRRGIPYDTANFDPSKALGSC